MELLVYLIENGSLRSVHGIFWVLAIGIFIVWVWSLIYLANRKVEDQTRKLCWLIIVLFFGPLGSLLYFFWGRENELLNENADDYEKWIQADPSRAYMSKDDRLAAFENYQQQT